MKSPGLGMVSAKMCLGRRSESNLKKPPAVSPIQVLANQSLKKINLHRPQTRRLERLERKTLPPHRRFVAAFSTGYCRILKKMLKIHR